MTLSMSPLSLVVLSAQSRPILLTRTANAHRRGGRPGSLTHKRKSWICHRRDGQRRSARDNTRLFARDDCCCFEAQARSNRQFMIWPVSEPCRPSITECIYWLIRRLILEKTATLKLQRWGNSLALRIPSSIARSVGFKVGQPVEVSTQDSAVRVAAAGEPRLTLKQKLARFDPDRHGGEAMATKRAGNEVL